MAVQIGRLGAASVYYSGDQERRGLRTRNGPAIFAAGRPTAAQRPFGTRRAERGLVTQAGRWLDEGAEAASPAGVASPPLPILVLDQELKDDPLGD